MQEPKVRLPKALSPSEVDNMDIECFDWGEDWSRVFGNPALTGIWMVWGDSGSGKTSFCLQLAKELSKFGKVIYNSLEQGRRSLTMQQAMRRSQMSALPKGAFRLTCEEMDVLSARLSRKHSPDIAIIDSIQYTGFRAKDLFEFKRKHANKLIIFVSQIKNGEPDGSVAQKAKFDSDLKIYLQGYRAFSRGRTMGDDPNAYYTIWEEGAARYWIDKE